MGPSLLAGEHSPAGSEGYVHSSSWARQVAFCASRRMLPISSQFRRLRVRFHLGHACALINQPGNAAGSEGPRHDSVAEPHALFAAGWKVFLAGCEETVCMMMSCHMASWHHVCHGRAAASVHPCMTDNPCHAWIWREVIKFLKCCNNINRKEETEYHQCLANRP